MGAAVGAVVGAAVGAAAGAAGWRGSSRRKCPSAAGWHRLMPHVGGRSQRTPSAPASPPALLGAPPAAAPLERWRAAA
eukprot:4701392-Prymnesium_polylepis.1